MAKLMSSGSDAGDVKAVRWDVHEELGHARSFCHLHLEHHLHPQRRDALSTQRGLEQPQHQAQLQAFAACPGLSGQA